MHWAAPLHSSRPVGPRRQGRRRRGSCPVDRCRRGPRRLDPCRQVLCRRVQRPARRPHPRHQARHPNPHRPGLCPTRRHHRHPCRLRHSSRPRNPSRRTRSLTTRRQGAQLRRSESQHEGRSCASINSRAAFDTKYRQRSARPTEASNRSPKIWGPMRPGLTWATCRAAP